MATIALKNAADADVTFTLSSTMGARQIFVDLSRANEEPRQLMTSSELRGKNPIVRSSVAKLTTVSVDPVDGVKSGLVDVQVKCVASQEVLTTAVIDEAVRMICKKIADDAAFRGNLLRGVLVA